MVRIELNEIYKCIYRTLIICFVLDCIYEITYDTIAYDKDKEHCGVTIENLALNEFVWIFSRSVNNIFWVIPIIYVFWPKLLFSKKNTIKTKRKININTKA